MTRLDSAVPDAGALRMRGGGPQLDRDEHFSIHAQDDGYRIATRIEAVDGSYRLSTELWYSAQWLPLRLRGHAVTAAGETEVVIARRGDEATLEVRGPAGAAPSRRLPCPADTLIDLEPSALPMWAMTRRYDRARGGVQPFRWIGRSLLRDLTLESLETPLQLARTDAGTEYFEFTESYPAAGGGSFTLQFGLCVDASGRLQQFSVDAGARRVLGTRSPSPLESR